MDAELLQFAQETGQALSSAIDAPRLIEGIRYAANGSHVIKSATEPNYPLAAIIWGAVVLPTLPRLVNWVWDIVDDVRGNHPDLSFTSKIK